jgi:hypothetical protein
MSGGRQFPNWNQSPWSQSDECDTHKELVIKSLSAIRAYANLFTDISDDVVVPDDVMAAKFSAIFDYNTEVVHYDKLFECYKAPFIRKFMLW